MFTEINQKGLNLNMNSFIVVKKTENVISENVL